MLQILNLDKELYNGKELGPTPPTDLAPGEKTEVHLIATSTDFNRWAAHPEVGSCDQSHDGEHGEHDSEHGREHDQEGKNEHN